MILDEFVEIKWHASNKKYLVDLGYTYTGIGTIVLIKVCDLKLGSHCKLHVKCDVCGNEKVLMYRVYNKNIKSGGYYGYIEEYNICIEWDEKYHRKTKHKKSDMIREKYLTEIHNCHIIRINELDFLKDVDNQIIETVKILTEVIEKN